MTGLESKPLSAQKFYMRSAGNKQAGMHRSVAVIGIVTLLLLLNPALSVILLSSNSLKIMVAQPPAMKLVSAGRIETPRYDCNCSDDFFVIKRSYLTGLRLIAVLGVAGEL